MMTERDALRFWGYVDRRDEGCWNWLSWKMTVGYGCFQMRKKKYGAHRLSYELHYGPIPAGKLVLHSCDNRLCVRPDHLSLGSHRDNTQDMMAKRRGLVGERNGSAKLDPDKVQRIRRLYASGKVTVATLGALFGVTASAIVHLVHGKTWAHVAA